ncbi:MAG: hypothetical protein ACT4PJ_06310 [Gemmatimonadaceae bacterium]
MSGSAALASGDAHAAVRSRYGSIVIVGGGCYGSYYVRQLLRARDARALEFARLLVVDRNARCQVADTTSSERDVVLVQREWECFFDDYLGEAARTSSPSADGIVPSPLMPHLMFDWLLRRARSRWPHRVVERRALASAPNVPWQRAMPSGTHVVSFAEWMCPVNCVEPPMCPVIKGPRTWSMPPAVRAYVRASQRGDTPLAGPVIFHCEHRSYGVGMFDTQAVLDGDALIARAGEQSSANVLVGTVSHCHGALDVLHIGAGHAT